MSSYALELLVLRFTSPSLEDDVRDVDLQRWRKPVGKGCSPCALACKGLDATNKVRNKANRNIGEIFILTLLLSSEI